MSIRQLLKWFYLASPVFFLIDIGLGWDIRISFLDHSPTWKAAYYLFCFSIGIMMWRWSMLEPILGIIEGGVNMLLLTLSVLLPYYQAIDAISSGEQITNPLNSGSIINYILTGIFLMISMQVRSIKN
jgi:hypothetical protein